MRIEMRVGPFFVASAVAAIRSAPRGAASFENLVTFGDSYTDSGRLEYYINNRGNPPPVGTLPPESNLTASGGLAWGQYVHRHTGAAYFNYAISGATCSNAFIHRVLPGTDRPFPSVFEDELPSFVVDVQVPALYANRTAENTVYALWIGTNDLGYAAFLSDSQTPGTNITTYLDCVWSVFDAIYATGGRRFVLFNMAPLQLSPMYAAQSNGGAGDNQFWSIKTLYNETEYQYKMMQYTQLVNRLFDYGLPLEGLVKRRWPGAIFDLFDANRLLTYIHNDPLSYLEAPANVTGFYRHCNPINTNECTNGPNALDTFLWYDELHPSNRTGEVIAREFIGVVGGNSSYGMRYSHGQ